MTGVCCQCGAPVPQCPSDWRFGQRKYCARHNRNGRRRAIIAGYLAGLSHDTMRAAGLPGGAIEAVLTTARKRGVIPPSGNAYMVATRGVAAIGRSMRRARHV